MRLRLFAVLAALALAAVAGAVALDRSREPAPAAAHEVAIPALARTVTVSLSLPLPSPHARRLSAMAEEGSLPSRPMAAEVLTDSDCAPDAEGISRCRNVVRLEDGRRLVLRHPHDMRRVPCLAPGERVRLVPNSI